MKTRSTKSNEKGWLPRECPPRVHPPLGLISWNDVWMIPSWWELNYRTKRGQDQEKWAKEDEEFDVLRGEGALHNFWMLHQSDFDRNNDRTTILKPRKATRNPWGFRNDLPWNLGDKMSLLQFQESRENDENYARKKDKDERKKIKGSTNLGFTPLRFDHPRV